MIAPRSYGFPICALGFDNRQGIRAGIVDDLERAGVDVAALRGISRTPAPIIDSARVFSAVTMPTWLQRDQVK